MSAVHYILQFKNKRKDLKIIHLIIKTILMKGRKKRPNIRNDKSMEKNRQAKENHAILQLLFIVGSFAVGYVPNSGTRTLVEAKVI